MLTYAKVEVIKGLRGKYIKQVLSRTELSPKETRKHILDGFNDFTREIEDLLLN